MILEKIDLSDIGIPGKRLTKGAIAKNFNKSKSLEGSYHPGVLTFNLEGLIS